MTARLTPMTQGRVASAIASLSTAALAAALAGCGGNNDKASTATISGTVADGPLQGATACYDLNDNAACDTDEPSATTAADGSYRFDVARAQAGQHAVIVDVPATAIDADTGMAVGTAFTLKAPPTGDGGSQSVFVSPLTTLVVEVAASQGLDHATAAASVQSQLGLAVSPLSDYVAGGDGDAATLARTVNTVITRIAALAESAGVPAAEAQALVASVSSGNLPTLAALVQASAGSTPAEVADEVATAVLAERNLSADTVAEQADIALAVATATPATDAPGPFVSVRRFTWTDADNHQLQAFVGDSTPGGDGRFPASEVRVNRAAGAEQPFNRNQVYWVADAGAWVVCPRAWEIVSVKPADSLSPQESVFCGASLSRTRIAEVDVSGQRMADVVAKARASSLRDAPGFDTDADGRPVKWGPDPAALGDATFPAGSAFSYREQVTEIGGPERYSLVDKPRIVPASGSGTYRHAATFADLKRMSGDLVDPAVTVSNANTTYLDDVPTDQADPNLLDLKRYRIAFDPAGDAVRMYACDVQASNSVSLNCAAVGDGTSAIGTQGDGRILRITAGYPAALLAALKRQRHWVERSGAVFGGYRDLEQTRFQQRLNTTGWNALRTALGMAEPAAPGAPSGPGPARVLRSFSFADVNNYAWRAFSGDSSQLDSEGYFLADDERVTVSGGVAMPFVRNRLYWTGSQWYACPDDGVGVIRANSVAPFDSLYCQTYGDERHSSVVATLDGRNMAEVVRDIRWYSTKDFGFDYANWGPDPDLHAALASATFPAGSTLEYRGQVRTATPIAIASASPVRVPPADTSVAFDTWPVAATLDEFIAKYPGDLLGGPLNGATAFWVHGYTLPQPPAPEYTNQVEIRVAFDANGSKARFWRNYRSASTGFTTAYEKLLDTTYSVQTLGDAKVLSFAAMPDGFEAEHFFQRMYAERSGGVWYAFKDAVPAAPQFNLRLNGTATDALAATLGIQ